MPPDQPPNRQYLISHWTDFVRAYTVRKGFKITTRQFNSGTQGVSLYHSFAGLLE
jgi:hypothetical protein